MLSINNQTNTTDTGGIFYGKNQNSLAIAIFFLASMVVSGQVIGKCAWNDTRCWERMMAGKTYDCQPWEWCNYATYARAYQTVAGEMMTANITKTQWKGADGLAKYYLAPYFGDLLDQTWFVYNANMFDGTCFLGHCLSDPSAGLTFCDRIYIDHEYIAHNTSILKSINDYDVPIRNQFALVAHELVHAHQCRELGGSGNFGYHYLAAFFDQGWSYSQNPLEWQARCFGAGINKLVGLSYPVGTNEYNEGLRCVNELMEPLPPLPPTPITPPSPLSTYLPAILSIILDDDAPASYSLTVNTTGNSGGAGTVSSNPTGINCGSTCSANFNSGTTVTLTASPSTGSTFGGWSGGNAGCTGTGNCVVNMTAAKSVTATFNGGTSSNCQSSIAVGATVSGNWGTSCASTHRSGSYAKFYTFTLSTPQTVVINLTSSAVDSFLFLLNGSGKDGTKITSDDDSGGSANAKITWALGAGTYTIEATTFRSNLTGAFSLSVQ